MGCDARAAILLNSHRTCDVVLLDFVCVFDKVLHFVVMRKLTAMRIGQQPCEWVADFLRNRSQCVCYGDTISASAPVLSGLIQWSVLEPRLVTAIINDLPNVITSRDMYLFAEDGKTVVAARTAYDQDAIQHDLQAVGDWPVQNNLPLSMDKSMCQHYGYNSVNANYVINDEPLKVVECCTDLGILKSSDFRYKGHIDQTCLKANTLSGMVAKFFLAKKDAHFMVKLFTTYIRLLVEYATVVWSSVKVGHCTQLKRVKHHYTHKLFNFQTAPAYDERLHILGLPSFNTGREATNLTFAFKVLHGLIDADAISIGI